MALAPRLSLPRTLPPSGDPDEVQAGCLPAATKGWAPLPKRSWGGGRVPGGMLVLWGRVRRVCSEAGASPLGS